MTKTQALPVDTLKRIRLNWWTGTPLFLLFLIPLFRLVWRGFRGDLTANPIQFITYSTGDWTLRFLMLTLAITPLPFLLNQPELFRFRRMTGFFAFFYGFLHVVNWICLDEGLYTGEMWDDIFRQRFIAVGLAGLTMVAPLSVTPKGWWERRLGLRPSMLLHQGVYFVATAGVIYYYLAVKSDVRFLLAYGAILSVLLLYRASVWFRDKRTTESESDLRAA